jgi:anti-sigma regulatory factor (Ser/Thr protein kinase)
MQWGHDPDGDTGQVAALVVSELCANAVRHGHVAGRGFRLRLALGAVMLRIEVTDAGSALPPDNPRTAGPECEYGRGLALVEALTLRWGMRPELIGKTVWCELEANGG